MNDRENEVLGQYEFTVLSAYRGRGAAILETDRGLKSFREFSGSDRKLQFQCEILEHIRALGMKSDFLVKNAQGELISRDRDGNGYVVRDWYEGRECNIRDLPEVMAGVRSLARLHMACRDVAFSREEDPLRYRQDVEEVFRRRNQEMRRTRAFMRERRGKTDFELFFLGCCGEFLEKGLAMERSLQSCGCRELEEEACRGRRVCHGSYNQHSLLFTRGETAIMDFSRCFVGIQLSDLHDFMRKVMEKWDWDYDVARRMLESYQRICPVSGEELRYLRIRLCYPEKFWKIANHYNNRRKSWIPEKNMEKLRMVVGQEKKKERCLDRLFFV